MFNSILNKANTGGDCRGPAQLVNTGGDCRGPVQLVNTGGDCRGPVQLVNTGDDCRGPVQLGALSTAWMCIRTLWLITVTVRPCLSGPFELPKDYELASPVYTISPGLEFIRDVKLFMAHFADLQNEDDCKNMTFLTTESSSSPLMAAILSSVQAAARRKYVLLL